MILSHHSKSNIPYRTQTDTDGNQTVSKKLTRNRNKHTLLKIFNKETILMHAPFSDMFFSRRYKSSSIFFQQSNFYTHIWKLKICYAKQKKIVFDSFSFIFTESLSFFIEVRISFFFIFIFRSSIPASEFAAPIVNVHWMEFSTRFTYKMLFGYFMSIFKALHWNEQSHGRKDIEEETRRRKKPTSKPMWNWNKKIYRITL